MRLAELVLQGDRLALARLLTQVENNTITGRQGLDLLFPHTGRAHLIGVTGAPGTGKSSLVNQLARVFRKPAESGNSDEKPTKVAILAVDPSSPFTGGAILGDRVRMRDLTGDSGVFIRSMATRGSLGGLASATASMVQVFDAAGFNIILIETVGAGQAEVEIAHLAHTTLVVEAPGLGDEIQAIKAGILEIADILVINKADNPHVDSTELALRSMLHLAHPVPHIFIDDRHHHSESKEIHETPPLGDSIWIPPIQRTIATEGKGILELVKHIRLHYQHLRQSGKWQTIEHNRLKSELDEILQGTLVARWRASIPSIIYEEIIQRVARREISPWKAVDVLLDAGG